MSERATVCGGGKNTGTVRSVHPAANRRVLLRSPAAALGQSGLSPCFWKVMYGGL